MRLWILTKYELIIKSQTLLAAFLLICSVGMLIIKFFL